MFQYDLEDVEAAMPRLCSRLSQNVHDSRVNYTVHKEWKIICFSSLTNCTHENLAMHNAIPCILRYCLITFCNLKDFQHQISRVLCRTSNRSMLARSRSEKCAFVLARSSKMLFFVQISVRYSKIPAEQLMFI